MVNKTMPGVDAMADTSPLPIDGKTRLVGMIADPIAHARSLQVVNRWLQARGLMGRFVMLPMHVAAGDLAAFAAAMRGWRNLAGLFVSMPHKADAASLADSLSPEARMAGSVNVLRRLDDGSLSGSTMDGEGLVRSLPGGPAAVTGSDILLVGAGGSAAAIAFALAQHGCASLTIHNRTPAHGDRLASAIGAAFPALPIHRGLAIEHFGVAVNATSLGMEADDPLPIPVELLPRCVVVADVVASPSSSPAPLLVAAAAVGCRTSNGQQMLEAQIDLMLDFLGVHDG